MEEENKVETLDETTTTPVVETIEPVTEAPTTAPVALETPSEPAPAETPAEPVTEAPAPVETPTEAPSETPAAEPATEATAPAPEETPAPKKKSGGILLILLILVLAFFAVWFFVLGGNEMLGLKKKAEEPVQQEEKKEEEQKPAEDVEKKLSEADVKSYLDVIEHFVEKHGNKIPLKTSDLTNQEVLRFASYYTGEDKSASNFEKVIADIFGKDFSYQLEDIQCLVGDGPILVYDEEAGVFNPGGTHAHGAGDITILAKEFFLDATEKGDTLEIMMHILFGGSCDDLCHPVMDFYANGAMTDSIYTVNDPDTETYDAMYPQLKDQLPTTTFVYKKQSDGNFGLAEIKVE